MSNNILFVFIPKCIFIWSSYSSQCTFQGNSMSWTWLWCWYYSRTWSLVLARKEALCGAWVSRLQREMLDAIRYLLFLLWLLVVNLIHHPFSPPRQMSCPPSYLPSTSFGRPKSLLSCFLMMIERRRQQPQLQRPCCILGQCKSGFGRRSCGLWLGGPRGEGWLSFSGGITVTVSLRWSLRGEALCK